jgi:hypothetical protein
MNPPFRRGLDVKHILHARTLLANGGRIVALCYHGAKQQALRPICSQWEPIAGAFTSEGTQAEVVLLVIDN